jgi:hypothetical protein
MMFEYLKGRKEKQHALLEETCMIINHVRCIRDLACIFIFSEIWMKLQDSKQI